MLRRLGLACLLCLAQTLVACAAPDLGFVSTPSDLYGQPFASMNPSSAPDKLDLLLVIDNSPSMADKQEIFAEAIPELVRRLTSPQCSNNLGQAVERSHFSAICPVDYPIPSPQLRDIHIGIVDTSLGGHGADSCSNALGIDYDPQMEGLSHLLTRADPEGGSFPGSTWNNKGFLLWDSASRYSPAGDSDAETLARKFATLVLGTGDKGCSFESSLEAWYRFLVEPIPYQRMVPYDCSTDQPSPEGMCRGPEGVDEVLLAQRGDFLRPDSIVAIVLLSDENDCSVRDSGQSYLALQELSGSLPFHLPRATSTCASDPASPACRSCGEPGQEQDPECQKAPYNDLEDSLNLRCYRQKQRYGVDFLYPISRYKSGLTELFIPASDSSILNPLFCTHYGTDPEGGTDRSSCAVVLRPPAFVLFAAIVGVPWQDLAKDPADLGKGYRPLEELSWTIEDFAQHNQNKSPEQQHPVPPGVDSHTTLWDQIVGKVDSDFSPRVGPEQESLDPLMVESIEPRSGVNPATGSPIAPPSASSPTANPANGHERHIPLRNDLQYACTFPLLHPREGSAECANATATNTPLCQDPFGVYGNTQFRGRAYPGLRQLALARSLPPGQAAVASICPSSTADPEALDYGYRPAVSAITRLLGGSGPGCWDTTVQYEPDGSIRCKVLEATSMPEGTTECVPCESRAWRTTPPASLTQWLRKDPNFLENNLKCLCAIPQARTGAELTACLDSEEARPWANGGYVQGWCFIDLGQRPSASEATVAHCPQGARRAFRFLGEGTPVTGSLPYYLCESAPWY